MRVNIFIRKEDEAKWKQIPDKPAFLHNAINGTVFAPDIEVIDRTAYKGQPVFYKTKRNEDMKFCKHSAVLGFCKMGCK